MRGALLFDIDGTMADTDADLFMVRLNELGHGQLVWLDTEDQAQA